MSAEIAEINAGAVPTVSICMPIYNSAAYLRQAIESVLTQSYRDFELLIVDDCSTDGSDALAAEYAAADPRVRFVRNQRNLGMVPNWNYCLQLAQGRYVRYLFGDDYILAADAISRQVAILDAHPRVSLVSSARLVVDENGQTRDLWRGFRDMVDMAPRRVIQACLELYYLKDGRLKFGCLKNLIGEPSAVMFRKEQATRGFNGVYRQLVDLEMWFHLLRQGTFAYCAEPLVAFRQHAAQQTVVNTKALVHIWEYLSLIKDNIRFAYPFMIPPLDSYALMYECYRIVKLNQRDGIFTADIAQSSIAKVVSPTAYRRALPLFLLFLPLYKLAAKLARPLLTRYVELLPDTPLA